MAAAPMSHRLAITLIAKGSINNLHRQDVVDAFRARGVDVRFLVREAYAHLIKPLPGCGYLTCRFAEETGRLKYWRDVFRYARSLYPDGGMSLALLAGPQGRRQRIQYHLLRALATRHAAMRLVLRAEERLYRSRTVEGLDPTAIDQLLLQGIGIHGAEHETSLTWWARQHGISVVHMVGNYDHLASKGYRGVPVDRLVVWGPVMRDDAVRLHGVPSNRVQAIGPVRYDAVMRDPAEDRSTFLRRLGLDPAKRTILFAGSGGEYHYFEMLQAFEDLRTQSGDYQLILRTYPDKVLMASPYTLPLIQYARSVPGVYVSVGDPHAKDPGVEGELPQIEQNELWHALRHCDVVVNLYSTIALEACLFDKPAIYMAYFPMRAYAWRKPPEYVDYGVYLHNRRLIAYGATPVARDRTTLLRLIQEAVANPDRHKRERAHAVQQELGQLDGRVTERLANACIEVFRERERAG
jgi:hypothetical protein